MGAYLTFNLIEKNEDFIVGKIPSLKMYEAKLSLVEKNYLNNGNYSVSFKYGGHIFTEFEQKAINWEYYTFFTDCYFLNFANIICSIDTTEYEDGVVYLYESEFIKNSIENVIKYANFGGFPDQTQYEEDLKQLKYFLEILKNNVSENILVSCRIG